MLYRSLRVVVTDWGNQRGRIFFPTGFAPSDSLPSDSSTIYQHQAPGSRCTTIAPCRAPKPNTRRGVPLGPAWGSAAEARAGYLRNELVTQWNCDVNQRPPLAER